MKWFLCALVTVMFTACDGGAEKHIAMGRKAAKNQQYAEALKHFDEALKANPADFNALWGKADVYRRDNNLPEQQKILEQILADGDLGQKHAGVVKPQLENNYRMQAESVMGASPEQAEALLRKAIELRKKSDANIVLAQLLMRRGDDLLKARKFAEAEKVYTDADALRMPRKLRAQLQGKAEIAGFMAFRDGFLARFDAVKPKLVEEGLYDEQKHEFVVSAAADLEALDRKAETFEADADKAGLVAVTEAIVDLTFRVAGKERPADATISYSASLVAVVEKGFDAKKKTFGYKVTIPGDAVFEKVRMIDEGKIEKKAAPAPEGEEKPAEEKPAEEQK